MISVEKRWQIASPISPEADRELQQYPRIFRQILYNRGLATEALAQEFLEARTPTTTDPSRLLGMQAAVERLMRAIQHGERIAIYGDYDVDGVTATALLVLALRKLGAKVMEYIPNRFDEGYGLNTEALHHLRGCGVQVVVTVDCGIRSIAEAQFAQELGIDLIITDHHHPGETTPDAVAVINPKQTNDPYPDKDLAGVGLAYKLATALYHQLAGGDPAIVEMLDLVTLGTVADLAPLVGENRYLVKAGLKRIRSAPRQGVRSLIGVAGLKFQRVTAQHISFVLGPRLNAAGRLDSALAAFQLLISRDVQTTGSLAQQLDDQNRHRQELTRRTQEKAEQLAIVGDEIPHLLFAVDEAFNPGVVGLAASRLVDSYYRPAIVAQRGDQFTRGSCRSIAEFHITQALDRCADVLEHHGGHAAAAGFTVKNERLPELRDRLEQIAEEELGKLVLRPTLTADAQVALSDLKPQLLEYLDWLEPTGYGNPQAKFVSRNLQVKRKRRVGSEGRHLKLVVSDGRITFDAIAFRQGDWFDHLPERVDLLFTFEMNEFNGRQTLQLRVLDIKPARLT